MFVNKPVQEAKQGNDVWCVGVGGRRCRRFWRGWLTRLVVGVKRDEASSPESNSSGAQLADGSWRSSEDRPGGEGPREGAFDCGLLGRGLRGPSCAGCWRQEKMLVMGWPEPGISRLPFT